MKKGSVPDGRTLLDLIDYGLDANGATAFFTYVIDLNGRPQQPYDNYCDDDSNKNENDNHDTSDRFQWEAVACQ